MVTRGEYAGASRTLDGRIVLQFAVDDDTAVESAERLRDKELSIEFKKYNEKRSLNANAYFWVLCDLIARKLGTCKDTIYLLQLSKYGVFVDVDISAEALDALKTKFRYVDVIDERGERKTARCYFGSSTYDTAEMGHLINGTINDAQDIGVETLPREEIENLILNWRGFL